MGELQIIPKRGGKAVRIARGDVVRVINTHGTQVVDTWAFCRDEPAEFMSMEHTRVGIGSIFPGIGVALLTNRRRPILTLLEDTSPGVHDTLMAACDTYRYQLLGCGDDHENCTDNLHAALEDIGFAAPGTPSPLNLWMNVSVGEDGRLDYLPPVTKVGDYVIFRAEMDVVIAFSACPQDQLPVNGVDCIPVEAHFEII